MEVNLTSARKHVFSAFSEPLSLASCVFSPILCKLQCALSRSTLATQFADNGERWWCFFVD